MFLLSILLQQYSNDEFFKHLTNWSNPIYYVIIFSVLIILLTRLFIVNFYFPKKEELEKEIEETRTKVMAQFAEMDPNPIIRVNINGDILHYNHAAKSIIDLLNNRTIKYLFSLDIRECIINNESHEFEQYLDNRFYSILFQPMSDIQMGQLYFSDLTERNAYEIKLETSEKKLRDLSFYLQDKIEEEKNRIGLELHDSIGQNLMLIKMGLNSSLEKNNFIEAYNSIANTIDVTIDEIKGIIFNLRPRVLQDIGLYAAVESLVDRLNKVAKIKGSINLKGTPFRFNYKNEIYLFRIAQEAINNIHKHSKANEYYIQFFFGSNEIKIIISDDGIGFDQELLENNKGNGLFNMNERMSNIKGSVNIESAPGEGTTIFVELPLTD